MKKQKETEYVFRAGYDLGRTSAINEILDIVSQFNYWDFTDYEIGLDIKKELKQKILALQSPQEIKQSLDNSNKSIVIDTSEGVSNKTEHSSDNPEDTLISINQVREIFEKDNGFMFYQNSDGCRCKEIFLEQLNKLGEKK